MQRFGAGGYHSYRGVVDHHAAQTECVVGLNTVRTGYEGYSCRLHPMSSIESTMVTQCPTRCNRGSDNWGLLCRCVACCREHCGIHTGPEGCACTAAKVYNLLRGAAHCIGNALPDHRTHSHALLLAHFKHPVKTNAFPLNRRSLPKIPHYLRGSLLRPPQAPLPGCGS
eukprot:1138055-Pelagomonas_calceolata.AAC.4